jgi:hypothetical protein
VSFLRPRFEIAAFLKFTAVFGVILALMHVSGAGLIPGAGWTDTLVYPTAMALVCALSLVLPKVTSPRCQACGRKYLPTMSASRKGLCPYCRVATAPRAERRRQAKLGFFLLAFLFLVVAFGAVLPFVGQLQADHGWLAPTAVVLGLGGALFLLFCGAMVVRVLAGKWSMMLPGHGLKVARTCAGERGRETSFGAVTVHVLGGDDPTPMLQDQFEVCRSRFEGLVGEPFHPDRPLRVFAFGRRAPFEGFCRRYWIDPLNLDGLYLPVLRRTIIITGEFPPYRLGDPQRVLRTLLTYFNLDAFKKCRAPIWIEAGVANLIACGGDNDELARLNRKMVVSLARGTTIGAAALLNAHPVAWIRLMKDAQNLASFMKYTQFWAQAWSLVEFLGGSAAPTARREQFRGFLRELKPGAPQAPVFAGHFGQSFETMLEEWRAWVLARGVGTHEPPPDRVRYALRERLIPIVKNRSADRRERIQAIRDMGRAGYALGADALIEIVAGDDPALAEEAIWSLEAISGLTLEGDARRWSEEWLAGLPEDHDWRASRTLHDPVRADHVGVPPRA